MPDNIPTTVATKMAMSIAHDAAAFFTLNSDPAVMRFTGEPLVQSVEAARDALARYPDFDTVGYGR